MSFDGRRPSRQRIAGPPLEPRPYHGPNTDFDDGALGVLPAGPQQPSLESAPPTAPQAAQAGLYGLAAELAGQAPEQGSGPATSAPRQGRPPARLGPARGGNAGPLAPPLPISSTAGLSARQADPFSNPQPQPQLQSRRLPPAHHQPHTQAPDSEAPYGLAAELLNNTDPASSFAPPPSSTAPTRRGERLARRALGPQLSAAQSRQGSLAYAAGAAAPVQQRAATPLQPPPLDPFTVMELAASQPGLPEPDYGIVAELRNRASPDPFASDFGLAAEVARRRSRSPSPLGRGAGAGTGVGSGAVGVLPPPRLRRRLDPVVPPGAGGGEGFGLDSEIAARQRQTAADVAEPFRAAAERSGRSGGGGGDAGGGFGAFDGADPFELAADEQLKVPKELLQPPYESTQQELPGDSVPLKDAGDGAGGAPDEDGALPATSDKDPQQYGIASELGVDPLTGMRQELLGREALGLPPLPAQSSVQPGGQAAEPPEPPGHKYVYDEDTGMLVTTAGGQGDGGRVARQYIEDEVTGVFYQLHSTRRKFFGLLRRKEPAVMEDDDEEEVAGFRGRLRRTLLGLTNFFNILGMFAEGLAAGFALLNFFMTYMLYGSTSLREFLRYYGPLAQSNNRLYYSLLVLAVISSTCRLARDRLRSFQPRHLQLAAVDYGQMLLYVAAYILSILCTPLDDELTYEAKRNPRFYQLTFSAGFKRRLALWHALNILRTIATGLAWALACYQTSPYVFEATLRAELKAFRRQQALMGGMTGGGGATATNSPHKAGAGNA